MNRLISGHCFFSHNYLMNSDSKGVPPICHYCNDAILTVNHVFVECSDLSDVEDTIILYYQRFLARIFVYPKLLGFYMI